MRTTLDIDEPVLRKLKDLKKGQRASLGRLVSDLLAESLHRREEVAKTPTERLTWNAAPLQARVALNDRDALYDAMDEEP